MPVTENQVRQVLLSAVSAMRNLFLKSSLVVPESGDPELLSLSILGRDLRARRIDRIMDIDTVVVLRGPMTREHYRAVECVFLELQNLTSPGIVISFMIADGPIKPLPSSEYTLFFHVILHTMESYRSSPLLLVKNSWQYDARLIYGMPIVEIEKCPEPDIMTVISSPLGIEHSLALVNDCASTYLKWEPVGSNSWTIGLTALPFHEQLEIVEICCYAVLRAASNALRYVLGISRGIGIDDRDMDMFRQVFSEWELCDFPSELHRLKKSMRTGSWVPTVSDTEQIIGRSRQFLGALISYLPKKKPGAGPYQNSG